VKLEENATKSVASTPEKSVVKERILEKIDLSKGISIRRHQLVLQLEVMTTMKTSLLPYTLFEYKHYDWSALNNLRISGTSSQRGS